MPILAQIKGLIKEDLDVSGVEKTVTLLETALILSIEVVEQEEEEEGGQVIETGKVIVVIKIDDLMEVLMNGLKLRLAIGAVKMVTLQENAPNLTLEEEEVEVEENEEDIDPVIILEISKEDVIEIVAMIATHLEKEVEEMMGATMIEIDEIDL